MSNVFIGEGNIGIDPELETFTGDKKETVYLLRFSVYFDNPVKGKDGKFEDKGGFWSNVEIWGKDVNKWADIYQKGQRVQVQGRLIRETWTDKNTGEERTAMKVRARRVGILPFRVDEITMRSGSGKDNSEETFQAGNEFDDDIPF